MEKKNTILLTVIAIATLLVAVVGATFAYFTATVTTTNDDNNTIEAKTYALTTVQMNYGNKVTSEGIYPGTTIVKDVSIEATCPAGSTTCEPVNTVLTVTTTDNDNVFGNDIKWSLYKMSTKDDEVACTVTPHTDGGQYYSDSVCTGLDSGTLVDTGVGAGTKAIDIKAYGTVKADATANEAHDDKYYLVVEYLNHQNEDGQTVEQNNQQGKTFTVALYFAAKQ